MFQESIFFVETMFLKFSQVFYLAAIWLSCKAVEINLLDDFDISEGMDDILETEGLPYEGKAFTFGDVEENLLQRDKLAREIARQTKVYAGYIVTANVKVDNNQECALVWIETIYSK